MRIINNAVKMAHHFLAPKLSNACRVVDATAGNSNDTLFLALNTPNDAEIWAFDIQEAALTKTRELLKANGCESKIRYIFRQPRKYAAIY